MKNSRFWPWLIAGGVIAAALAFHFQSRARREGLRRRAAAAVLEAEARERQIGQDEAELHAAQARLDALSKPRPNERKGSAEKGRPRAVEIAENPRIRSMAVQAYVSQRRLDFAGLFKRLGLAEAQRLKFDEIQAQHEQGLLDLAAGAAKQGIDAGDPGLADLKAELARTRDGQLQSLFGPSFGAYGDAEAAMDARRRVNQLLQQNLQGPGALEPATADRLTAIVASHRTEGRQPDADPTGYDWEAILGQAGSILSPAQMDGMRTSVAYLQAQAQMQRIAAGH